MSLRFAHSLWLVTALLLPLASQAGDSREAEPANAADLTDLYFGEALFHAHQGHFFEAIERLDVEVAQHYRLDERQRDTLFAHIDDAEFSVGDFELHYRMHHRAGRAIRAVLEADVAPEVRNAAAFRLARLHFQKGQAQDALRVLDQVAGPLPEGLAEDVAFLRANVLISEGQSAAAVPLLSELLGLPEWGGFSGYNLGIAQLRLGKPVLAMAALRRAGKLRPRNPAEHAIRDKANLLLGSLLFEGSRFEDAKASLERVRLEGPFSNQALLRAGWSDLTGERAERAIVSWGLLRERDATDPAVQEAMLALPHAYSKMERFGRAARLYGEAAQGFVQEIEKLDASLESVRSGAFLAALLREELRRSEDWVVRLRSLPDAPETFYLIRLMASHEFQTALQNLLDLEDLRERLVSGRRSLAAFEELTETRAAYYEPRLPGVDAEFRKLDARYRLRLEQRKQIGRRLEAMLTAPRPDLLANRDEQQALAQLDEIDAQLQRLSGRGVAELQARARRLRASFAWTLETEYHERLTRTHEHYRALTSEIEKAQARYDEFVRARQAAVHGYRGYAGTIDGNRNRSVLALRQVKRLLEEQGRVLKRVAIRELEARRRELDESLNQARFAFAENSDRAVKAQARRRIAAEEAE